jgi:hypothetical protein
MSSGAVRTSFNYMTLKEFKDDYVRCLQNNEDVFVLIKTRDYKIINYKNVAFISSVYGSPSFTYRTVLYIEAFDIERKEKVLLVNNSQFPCLETYLKKPFKDLGYTKKNIVYLTPNDFIPFFTPFTLPISIYAEEMQDKVSSEVLLDRESIYKDFLESYPEYTLIEEKVIQEEYVTEV